MAKNEYREYLKRVPLFRDLDKGELDAVGAVVTDLRFNAGQVLIRQGDSAHEMFIVTEGEIEVTPTVITSPTSVPAPSPARWPCSLEHRATRRSPPRPTSRCCTSTAVHCRRCSPTYRRSRSRCCRWSPDAWSRTATTTATDRYRYLTATACSTRPSAWRAKRRVAPVHGVVTIPRPAAEPGALIVGERLLDLRARVHHERAVLRDGLADRAGLEQQELGCVRCRSRAAPSRVGASRTPVGAGIRSPSTRDRRPRTRTACGCVAGRRAAAASTPRRRRARSSRSRRRLSARDAHELGGGGGRRERRRARPRSR